MGQSTFPIPSSGSSTSTVLPVNASSVLLDGEFTSTTSYTTTVNFPGGGAYLTANGSAIAFTISGTTYYVPAGSTIPLSASVSGSTSVTITSVPAPQPIQRIYTTPVIAQYLDSGTFTANPKNCAAGNGVFVVTTSNPNAPQNNTFFATNDRKNWIPVTVSYNTAQSFTDGSVCWTGSFFCAIPALGGKYFISYNGFSWTWVSPQNMPTTTNSYVGASTGFGNFVLSMANSGAYNFNASGIPFNATNVGGDCQSAAIATSGPYVGIAVGGVAGTGQMSYGSVQTGWTTVATKAMFAAWGNGIFVTCLNSTTVYYGANPASLSTGTLPSAQTCVTFGNGIFVTTGNATTGYYSTNGSTWTSWSTGLNNKLTTYSNGYFYGIGTSTVAGGTNAFGYYSSIGNMPASFGIYAAPVTTH